MLKEFYIHTYKSIILFSVGLVLVRVMGKRTLAQLSPFDLMFIVIMGAAIAIPLEDHNIEMTHGIMPVIITAFLNYVLAILITKNRKIENFFQGTSRVLVRNGEVIVKNLKKERITMADLLILLREKNVTNINELEEASIEPNGKLSIIKKKYMQTVTPRDLGLWSKQGIFPTMVVDQGQIIQDNLDLVGVSIDQMLRQINQQGIGRLKEIRAAWIDEEGCFSLERVTEQAQNNYQHIRNGQAAMVNKKEGLYKLNVSTDQIKKEFGVDLFLFLDAVSLGLRDDEIADLIGYNIEQVKKVRERLGNVSSEIGINYKKNLPK